MVVEALGLHRGEGRGVHVRQALKEARGLPLDEGVVDPEEQPLDAATAFGICGHADAGVAGKDRPCRVHRVDQGRCWAAWASMNFCMAFAHREVPTPRGTGSGRRARPGGRSG